MVKEPRPDQTTTAETISMRDEQETARTEEAAAIAGAPPHEPSSRRARIKAWVGGGASLLLVAIALFVLSRTLVHIDIWALRAAIASTALSQFGLALCFTALSYFALTGYDALALHQLRLRVPYRTTALGSFASYAISFMLGFPIVTGGTVRYWIYSRAGVKASKVASLTVVAGVTFWLGMAVVIGVGLVVEARPLSEIDQLAVNLNRLIGLGVLLAIAFYLIWVSVHPRRARVQGLRLELPGFGVTLGQMALGVVDLCCAAATLYFLLPSHDGFGFFTFASIYVFACLLGIASHAPGGIGVFEATMLKALPAPSQEALLASLLLFRIIYYVIPFTLALAMLGANEGGRRWNSLRETMNRAQSIKPSDDRD